MSSVPAGDVVFIFAHQDDEYGVLPTLAAEIARGRRAHCLYLTSGNAKGGEASVRNRESLTVLMQHGVDQRDAHFLGAEHSIDDGSLASNLGKALAVVTDLRLPGHLHRIYTLAWEGGHADHDAAHLLALALSHILKPADGVWQFPLYNGFGVPWRFFRVMKPLHKSDRDETQRLTFRAALRYALTFTAYRSQKKTWLGLAPEASLRYLVSRRTRIARADYSRVRTRPHRGKLLYERMFGVPYEEFARLTGTFIEDHVLGK